MKGIICWGDISGLLIYSRNSCNNSSNYFTFLEKFIKWYYLWMQKGGRAPKGMWTVRSGLWLPSPLYQHDLRASCKNTKKYRLTTVEILGHMLSLVYLTSLYFISNPECLVLMCSHTLLKCLLFWVSHGKLFWKNFPCLVPREEYKSL